MGEGQLDKGRAAAAVVTVLVLLYPLKSGCDKEGSTAPPPCVISGITVTDEDGRILDDDAEDWCVLYPNVAWQMELYPAKPNPFQIETTIPYVSRRDGVVLVQIVNAYCNVVRTLAEGEPEPGRKEVVWDGTDDSGRRVPPGLYQCVYEVTYPNSRFSCTGDIQVMEK
jgi:hypothetical protein